MVPGTSHDDATTYFKMFPQDSCTHESGSEYHPPFTPTFTSSFNSYSSTHKNMAGSSRFKPHINTPTTSPWSTINVLPSSSNTEPALSTTLPNFEFVKSHEHYCSPVWAWWTTHFISLFCVHTRSPGWFQGSHLWIGHTTRVCNFRLTEADFPSVWMWIPSLYLHHLYRHMYGSLHRTPTNNSSHIHRGFILYQF